MARPVVFRFAADVKQLKDGLSEAERDLRQFGGSMQRVGAGLTAGVTVPLAALGVASINAASDLDEALNVTRLTFGEAAGEIEAFGDTAAEALGQSKRAAMQAATTFGGLLRGVGQSEQAAAEYSKVLVGLSSDLASAFNTAPEDAVQALGSALRGESEPIRRYNVLLSDAAVRTKAVELGLADTTAAVDEQDKVLARYNLILERTSLVQGDFANTSDGLANSQRILSAELEDLRATLGESLLPLAERVVGTTVDMAQGFANLPGPLQDAIVGVAGLAAAAGPLLVVTGSVIRNFESIRTTAPGLASALGRGAGMAGAMFLAAEAAEALGGALADALGTSRPDIDSDKILNDLTRLSKGSQAVDLEGLFDPLFGLGDLGDVIDRVADPSTLQRIGDFISGVSGALPFGAGSRGLDSAAEALATLDENLTSLARSDGVGAVEEALFGLQMMFGLNGDQVESLVGLLPGLNVEMDRLALAGEDAADASGDAADGIGDVGDSAQAAAREVKTLSQRLRDQVNVLQEAADPVLAAVRATDRYEDSQKALNEAIKEHGEDSEEAERAAAGLLENLLEMRAAAALSSSDVAGFNAVLRTLEDQGLLSKQQIDLLGQSINDLPDNKNVNLTLNGADLVTPEILNELRGTSSASTQQTFNVNVSNPAPERTSDSIPGALRDAAFLAGF